MGIPESALDRRDFLLRSTALGLAAFGSLSPTASGGSCILTPSDVQGPFYLDGQMVRKDITEGLPGLPMTLLMKVVRASDCSPVPGAVVDIWHTDALGSYSGFVVKGTQGQTFLRGIQTADATGTVCFETIYPGWYPGRTPHFHVKVSPNVSSTLTTQVYLRDDISQAIHLGFPPYNVKGASPVNNITDDFYKPENLMRVARKPDGTVGLIGFVELGLPDQP